MPKKSTPMFETPDEAAAMETLLKKFMTQQKPKQKRTISEERKEQLRQQLVKGRENSKISRAKPKEEKVEVPKAPPNTPTTKQGLDHLENKFNDMITHLKEISSLQKEAVEMKKAKKKQPEPKKEDTEDWLFLPKKKEGPKKEEVKAEVKQEAPKPERSAEALTHTREPPKQQTPNYYYVPTANNRHFY